MILSPEWNNVKYISIRQEFNKLEKCHVMKIKTNHFIGISVPESFSPHISLYLHVTKEAFPNGFAIWQTYIWWLEDCQTGLDYGWMLGVLVCECACTSKYERFHPYIFFKYAVTYSFSNHLTITHNFGK